MSSTAAVVERVVATVTAVTPRGRVAAVVRETRATISAIARQGIAGPPGANAAAPRIFPIQSTASFTANHGLPFAPEIWIVTPAGEVIETDVLHSPGAATVVFPQPFTGTLYLR